MADKIRLVKEVIVIPNLTFRHMFILNTLQQKRTMLWKDLKILGYSDGSMFAAVKRLAALGCLKLYKAPLQTDITPEGDSVIDNIKEELFFNSKKASESAVKTSAGGATSEKQRSGTSSQVGERLPAPKTAKDVCNFVGNGEF